MTNKDYHYIILHESKTIYLPPPRLAGDIGSPPSWACYARSQRFKKHFAGYSNSILSEVSWRKMSESHSVLLINSNDME